MVAICLGAGRTTTVAMHFSDFSLVVAAIARHVPFCVQLEVQCILTFVLPCFTFFAG